MTPLGELMSWDGLNDNVSIGWLLTSKSDTGYTLMQYTGRKDKNDVEIYEGDYVKTHGWEGVIEFSHTGAWVVAQGSFKELLHDFVHNKWPVEIIGNIYENPELLQVAA